MPNLDIATAWQVSFEAATDQPPSSDVKLLWTDGDGFAVAKCGSGEYHMQFWNGDVVLINSKQKTVRLQSLSSESTADTIEHLLYDQVFPRLLAHEGRLLLHAGAVQIDGQLALFLGDSGRGKSTMVASLYQAGAAMLGDDALEISSDGQTFYGQALYRGLRLLPDSLARLFPQQIETLLMAHYSDKKRLNVAVPEDHDSSPQPLGALFFLAGDNASDTISLRRMSAAESCMAIISNSFSLDPTDPILARNKLQQASTLANGVAAFELSYPRDYAVLPQVHARIRAKMAESRPRKSVNE